MTVLQKLNDDITATQWLASQGVVEPKRALVNLRAIVESGMEAAAVDSLLNRLEEKLSSLSDADRAINNLERLVANTCQVAKQVLARDDNAFEGLLAIFSASQFLSDWVIREIVSFPEVWASCDLMSAEQLVADAMAQVADAQAEVQTMEVLRRFKQTQVLRIAILDLIHGRRIEDVTKQISFVAGAIIEAAYQWARRTLSNKLGEPINSNGKPCQFAVIAMGKLGGTELNYSSDIDLVMIFDENGKISRGTNSAQSVTHQEFFERLCRIIVKLIGVATDLGAAYRVDLRLRPNGSSGKICANFQFMMQYYDLQGRTWERQALIKATPVAGDLELGKRLLDQLAPWIYQRNLSRADISGIKALKRRIERRALAAGQDRTNIKTGHGGIRDVEFIIQFMQLLNAGELADLRTTNTLDAIARLERAQCLSSAESTVLLQNYQWLRKLEHRLQLMFDMQIHTIPRDENELVKVAKRMGFHESDKNSTLEKFRQTLNETTESNRKILNHLLHGAFGMAFGSLRNTGGQEHRLDEAEVPLEVDLILDPDPDSEMIEEVLSPYGFKEISAAFRHLMDLGREPTRFLSTRRCKHFLASVAPALLSELSKTPNPDASLVTLATVSESLGAKGVLWELFSFNPPTLSLYVRLCASSDYLVGILRSNPGMIDELIDALQLEGLPSYQRLSANLESLIRGAKDLVPIVHSFKNTQHMRVGIRDILGRDDVRETHRTLSDIAELCLSTIAQHCFEQLVEKHGRSDCQSGLLHQEVPLVILGLGKLGGREPNYHSDLDVIFLYDSNAETVESFEAQLNRGISCQFFFSELAAEITKFVGHSPSHGRLYEVDSRLRPTGKSGSLAVSMDEFTRYFESGKGQTWERLALCKARPVFGSSRNRAQAMQRVREAILVSPWQDSMASEVQVMRRAIEKDSTEHNLKRGKGGTVDVEFITQMLQIKQASQNESILVPGTLAAIEQLKLHGFLESKIADQLASGYQLLRSVEARLRLMNTTSKHDLPSDQKQLAKLAYLLNYSSAQHLTEVVGRHRSKIRMIFERLV
ncbi:MAG: bifunctional [glutamate--ammonia ligase]-adenylyl-L-tyrosine phosphorylase/[glutamate--ammonia-ligase] adenylyltransferase [Mariniblastus sp.]|nr:bifunctional [glutamate--ammonia ligase]-adenylyl-L-tyrosine phosphorylase/[glutamate--ammonia-ligase] adenylyltransferase [Mariniblastus sp.]